MACDGLSWLMMVDLVVYDTKAAIIILWGLQTNQYNWGKNVVTVASRYVDSLSSLGLQTLRTTREGG